MYIDFIKIKNKPQREMFIQSVQVQQVQVFALDLLLNISILFNIKIDN